MVSVSMGTIAGIAMTLGLSTPGRYRPASAFLLNRNQWR